MENIKEITITEIQHMYHQKKISVSELVEEYLKRIALHDQGKLNSIIEINPQVRSIAKALEEQQEAYSSKLFGVPILLKDNIDTQDEMHTSAGSLALAASFASADSDIVKILRQKGAVILGKTNMTEFANYMTKGMKAGYSSRGGVVKSPYKENQDPSGSSTGSAVAVTANLCAVSMGTDTAGSIISPAKCNGIVGFRPSIGALSLTGIIPISFTLDAVGPMTRTVMDSAIVYSELSNRQMGSQEVNIKDTVIGVDFFAFENLNKEEQKKATAVIKELEQSGATLKRVFIPQVASSVLKELERYEFKYSINRYLEKLPNSFPLRSLKDIINYNLKNPKDTLKYGQTLLWDAEENTRGDLSEPHYKKLRIEREETKKQVVKLLSGIDVCLQFQENLVLQFVGLPSITIPRGLNNKGMPTGVFLTALQDGNLLNYAHKMEQIIGRRVEPMWK